MADTPEERSLYVEAMDNCLDLPESHDPTYSAPCPECVDQLARAKIRAAEEAARAEVWLEHSDEDIAKLFHDHYEGLAPLYGHETQHATRTKWEDMPESNRCLAVATVSAVRLAMVERAAAIREGE